MYYNLSSWYWLFTNNSSLWDVESLVATWSVCVINDTREDDGVAFTGCARRLAIGLDRVCQLHRIALWLLVVSVLLLGELICELDGIGYAFVSTAYADLCWLRRQRGYLFWMYLRYVLIAGILCAGLIRTTYICLFCQSNWSFRSK